MKHNTLLGLAFLSLYVSSCTKDGAASHGVVNLIEDNKGLTPEASQPVEVQLQEIKTSLNQDITYQLTIEDQNVLVSESLVDEQSEIKTWVK